MSNEFLLGVALLGLTIWWLRWRLDTLQAMLYMLASPAPPLSDRDRELLTVGCNEEEAAREIRLELARRSRQSFAGFLVNLRSIEAHQRDLLQAGEDPVAVELDATSREIARLRRAARRASRSNPL